MDNNSSESILAKDHLVLQVIKSLPSGVLHVFQK